MRSTPLLSLLSVTVLVASCSSSVLKDAPSAKAVAETTVYITRTGNRYHRGSCSYLRQSRIPISLAKAKAQGYGPCSRCAPPR